jgi:hypothetical protein
MKLYERLINEVDSASIQYLKDGKAIYLSRQYTQSLKKVLTRHIKPEIQRKFISDARIELFRNKKRIAFLLIANDSQNGFANFNSDSLQFGFRLTYGIGMFINEIR